MPLGDKKGGNSKQKMYYVHDRGCKNIYLDIGVIVDQLMGDVLASSRDPVHVDITLPQTAGCVRISGGRGGVGYFGVCDNPHGPSWKGHDFI